MPAADPPSPENVVRIVFAREQLAKPLEQRPLEALDLGGAPRDHFASVRMAVDLGVKILDQTRQTRFDDATHCLDTTGVVRCPADVLLQFLIAAKQLVGVHGLHLYEQRRRCTVKCWETPAPRAR